MKLIVQPDAGVTPIVTAIRRAKKSIDVLIFRLDKKEILAALAAAVVRGVNARALIAQTNRGGEKGLRKLEMRLLDAGVTVSRTADDLVRYHGKMMIVDGRVLHVYGFNFTQLDIQRSRSFGIMSRNPVLVREALKLFEADCARQPYVAGSDRFLVSPENSRERLSAFIKAARKELLIYDPKVSDPTMVRLLADRAKAGVDIRIIGKLGGRNMGLRAEKYPGKRMHIRAIIRDRQRAFLGSQSLRKLEMDRRREIGVILNEQAVVKGMCTVFDEDWALTETGARSRPQATDRAKTEASREADKVAPAGA